MYLSSRAIYLSMAMAPVYILIFSILLSMFAHYIAWGLIVFVQIGLFFLSGFLLTDFVKEKQRDSDHPEQRQGVNHLWELGLAIIFFLAGIVYMIVVCCGFRELKIAVAIIDATADFIHDTKRVILVPFLFFFIMIFVTIFWMLCYLSMNSVGKITPSPSTGPQYKLVELTKDEEYAKQWFNGIMIFGLIWIWSFCKSMASFVTMFTTATYYYNSNPKNTEAGEAEMVLGFKYAFKYHVGSIALGATVMPIITVVRYVIVWPCSQIVLLEGSNGCIKCIIKIAELWLKCFEKLTDMVNDSAYSYMVIHGESFFKSARNAFLLNTKHANKFVYATSLAGGFMHVCKFGMMCLNLYSLYLFMSLVF